MGTLVGYRQGPLSLIVGPLIFAQVSDVRQMSYVLSSGAHRAVVPGQEVAAFLNTIRSPSDTLFTWDYLPSIYFATEMKSPTRLLDAHYIFDSAHSHQKFREEILRGLEQALPTFLVDGWNNAAKERLGAGDPLYRKFRELIEHHYVWIYTAGNFRVYRHQTAGKAAGE